MCQIMNRCTSSLGKLRDTHLGHEAGNSESTRQPRFELKLYTDKIFPAVVKCGIQITISVYHKYWKPRFPVIWTSPCPPGSCICPDWKWSSLGREYEVPPASLEAGVTKNQNCMTFSKKTPINGYFSLPFSIGTPGMSSTITLAASGAL